MRVLVVKERAHQRRAGRVEALQQGLVLVPDGVEILPITGTGQDVG